MNTKYTQESTLFVSALGKRQSDLKVKKGRLSNLSRQTALRNARAVEEGEKCNYSYLSY